MAFQVTNQKTGNSFSVEDAETVLDAAMRQSRVFSYSCRSGSCGSCKARLIFGEVDPGEYAASALSDNEYAAGSILLCQARPQSDIVIEANELPPGMAMPIRILPCRVVSLEKASHDVMLLQLKLPQNQQFEYLPGQYIDILLRDGRRRSFSIANAATDGEDLQLHVRLVPDGHFTGQVFTTMKARDLLRFQGPLGTFFLREDETRPAIMVGGGTGLAPLKAILEVALAKHPDRTFHLFWGVRSGEDLYFDNEIRRWLNAHPNLIYTPVLSEPRAADGWDGETGFVHEAVLREYPELDRFEVYASGPPPMIEALKTTFAAHGLAQERLFFDSFEFTADVK
jgi:CDP-4-dehydro-6-deoxyglucose reductase